MMSDRKYTGLGGVHLRPHSTQVRIYCFIVASSACLLAVVAAICIPLILFQNMDNDYIANIATVEQEMAYEAAKSLSDSTMTAYSVTQALEGYVMSRMRSLPNMSLPPIPRVRAQNFSDFAYFASLLLENTENIVTAMLVPGGVRTEMAPIMQETYMLDMFDEKDSAQLFVPTPQQSVKDGKVGYIGPILYAGDYKPRFWALAVRRPVFRYSEDNTRSWRNFWGFTQTLLNISAVLEQRPFEMAQQKQSKKYQGLDYVVTALNSRTGKLELIESSISHPTQDELEKFVEQGSSIAVTPKYPFMITVRGRDYGKWFSANNITIIVATATAGLFFIFAVFVALLLYCTQTYDGTVHAPKLAPFAILTVGPCRGEELWELAPDEMADVAERLSQLLTSQMQRHHAYQIQQVHPLTTSYVTRGVAAAVQMAFDAIEELHRHPIDAALQRLLGDDGCLLVSYAVHWCNDAVVRLDPMEGGYRYEGPDVVYGGRMWAFAPPSVVTASEAVAQALPRFGLCCVTAEPYRRVNVVRSRCACGATGDCDMNGSSGDSSGSGTATIYVPLSAPTTVAATAGMCRGGGGGGAALYRLTAMARDTDNDKDTPLPPQMLLTLVDPRRPVLMAARAAAQAHASHRHRWPLSMSLPNVADAEAHSPHPVHEVVAGSGAVARREAGSQNPLCGVRIGGSFHSSEEEMMEATSSAVPGSSLPNFGSSSSEVGVSGTTAVERVSLVIQGDGVTRALLRPVIPHALDVALHVAFDYQAITLGMSYNSMRVLVYYFYSSYKILFRPLAAPERHNIYRRLVTAFGVPQQGILEHLAARCAIRCLQHSSKQRQLVTQRRQPETMISTVDMWETPLPGIAARPLPRKLQKLE
ncbi:hypothetical protein ABB37_06896 [Leptomonas pyrrhocoris]|uniref:CHASE domain-containing protein n=1 Tax=Leptomonas pyrrhocoris TaxID=157538 RepID=A0A0N0DTJ3_LEPPY|nr:hypothetical protein ABB37_06896 [Leptomonas pyrrhocoris]KPA77511.1 hypothetical protein ABB37_06896 [Leptomonas pyrrhocoris]|eukprot:XP_015655950.1 hypothetical protein ABB37_06896 [Leptomonas pyrrhocoris]